MASGLTALRADDVGTGLACFVDVLCSVGFSMDMVVWVRVWVWMYLWVSDHVLSLLVSIHLLGR